MAAAAGVGASASDAKQNAAHSTGASLSAAAAALTTLKALEDDLKAKETKLEELNSKIDGLAKQRLEAIDANKNEKAQALKEDIARVEKDKEWVQRKIDALEADVRAARSAAVLPASDAVGAAAPVTPLKAAAGVKGTDCSNVTPLVPVDGSLPPEYDPEETAADAKARRDFIGHADASEEVLDRHVFRTRLDVALRELLRITTPALAAGAAGAAAAAATAGASGAVSACVGVSSSAVHALNAPWQRRLLDALCDPQVSAAMSAVAMNPSSGELAAEKVWCGPWTLLLLLPCLVQKQPGAVADRSPNARWFRANKKIAKENAAVDIFPDGEIGITSAGADVPLLWWETKPVEVGGAELIGIDTARLMHCTLVAAGIQLSAFESAAKANAREWHEHCRLPLLATVQVAKGQLHIAVYTHARLRSAVEAARKAAEAAEQAAKGQQRAAKRKATAAAAESVKDVKRLYLTFKPIALSDAARVARALEQLSTVVQLAELELTCSRARIAGADAKDAPGGGASGDSGPSGGRNGGNPPDGDDGDGDDVGGRELRSPLRDGQFRSRRPRGGSTDSTGSSKATCVPAFSSRRGPAPLQPVAEGDENANPSAARAAADTRAVPAPGKHSAPAPKDQQPLRQPGQQRVFGTQLRA